MRKVFEFRVPWLQNLFSYLLSSNFLHYFKSSSGSEKHATLKLLLPEDLLSSENLKPRLNLNPKTASNPNSLEMSMVSISPVLPWQRCILRSSGWTGSWSGACSNVHSNSSHLEKVGNRLRSSVSQRNI